MVVMTDGAGALLRQMQTQKELPNTLRLVVEQGELVVGTTAPAADDEVLYHGGAPVLRLSSDAAAVLDGCTVTTEDTPDGPALAIVEESGDEDDDYEDDE